MIDISLLRILKTRESFDKVYLNIPLKSLNKETQVIVQDIQKYYEKFTEHTEIDYIQFKNMFFSHWHRGLDEDKIAFYNKVLDRADKNLDEVSQRVMMNALLELSLADNTMQLVERYNSGEEIDIVAELESLVESTRNSRERKDDNDYLEIDFNELMADDENDTGLHYRNKALEASLKPARFGDDFLVVAARPNQGKTTFILSEITHMVHQVDERPVLWLNNEGRGERIVKRGVQVALGATTSEMIAMHEQGTLLKNYEEAIKAPHDRIRVKNIHDYWNWEVEELIETHQPKIVVFDMIDHIKFAGLSLAGGSRTDQILEEMYKWARNLGVKYNLMPIATSQVSVDGEGIPYPDKSMLKDSKTGKQGAADTIMMLGHSNDPMMLNSRFISTPKTKSKREGIALPRAEVFFDVDRGRFEIPGG